MQDGVGTSYFVSNIKPLDSTEISTFRGTIQLTIKYEIVITNKLIDSVFHI